MGDSSGSQDLSEYQKCLEVLRSYEGELIALPDVLGVGVGRSDEGEMGLVLLMRRLPTANEVQESRLPAELRGVPIWPRLIGSIQPQQGGESGR